MRVRVEFVRGAAGEGWKGHGTTAPGRKFVPNGDRAHEERKPRQENVKERETWVGGKVER